MPKTDTEYKRDCATCDFAVDGGKDPMDLRSPRKIYCHALPPVPYPMQDSKGGIGSINLWPLVHPGGWCGQYIPLAFVRPDHPSQIHEKTN